MIQGHKIRVRYTREFPTNTISAFGAISSIPSAILSSSFSRFGRVCQLTANGGAEGWVLVGFARLEDACNCLLQIRYKIVAGSLIEANFANQTEHIQGGDGDLDDFNRQILNFDSIKSACFLARIAPRLAYWSAISSCWNS